MDNTTVVKCVASKFKLPRTGETDEGYQFIVKPTGTITPEAFVADLAASMGVKPHVAEAWAKAFARTVVTRLMDNYLVNTGWCVAQLFVTGSGKSASDQPTKERNPVVARLSFTGEIGRRAKALVAVNMTLTVEASLLELAQAGLVEQNLINTAGARIVATGRGLTLNLDNPDEYVALYKDNTLVKSAEVIYSDAANIQFRFPSLPETGVYDLVISTRNGESPDEYTTTILKRKVQVVND
jgi:hypothetical protein